MKLAAKIIMGLTLGLASLFLVSGRGLREFLGYAQATADHSVDRLADQLGDDIQDRKLQQDLAQMRQEAINRQVQLNQSQTRIAQWREDVQKLETSVEGRKRLLAEAYPILDQAARDKLVQVRFASATMPIEDFQRDIDGLLASQKRDEEQLAVKRDGLARLEKSEREARLALDQMRRAAETLEQEAEVLKTRREQARIESQTIDMVSSVSGGHQQASSAAGASIDRLRGEVAHLEAENDAKRGLAAPAARDSANRLSGEWARLEALKAIRDQQAARNPNAKVKDNGEPDAAILETESDRNSTP